MRFLFTEKGFDWKLNQEVKKICGESADLKNVDATRLIQVYVNEDGSISVMRSNALLEFRLAKGLTQRELAESLGVSAGTVSHWENGGKPNLELIQSVYPSFQMVYTPAASYIYELARARRRKYYADCLGRHPEFARYFKEQTAKAGLTVNGIAKELGVSSAATQSWASGRVIPNKANMAKVKAFFKKSQNRVSMAQLSNLLKNLGLSKKAFAATVGVSVQTVQNWSAGRTSTNWDKIYSSFSKDTLFAALTK